MRTKTLLLAAAAIAAGVISSQAQSNVYSANVVGYVNKSFPQFSFALICNPLKNTNDLLSTIVPAPPDGTAVYQWDYTTQDVKPTVPTYYVGVGWSPDVAIAPGEGFYLVGGDVFTNTFVGEVRQGSLTNVVNGNLGFDLLGSQVAMGGSLATNILTGYTPTDGDAVYLWDVNTQDVDPSIPTYYEGVGWTPDGTVAVGDAFMLVRQGGLVDWVRNFTVQ